MATNETLQCDVLIIGSGIAGATAALNLAENENLKIIMLTKYDDPLESNTFYAQGGIIYTGQEDSPEQLAEDLTRAGDGLNSREAVSILSHEGPRLVRELLVEKYQVPFTLTPQNELERTREAAHSTSRILHVNDATGRAIQQKLVEALLDQPNITIMTQYTAIDLLTPAHHSLNRLAIYEPLSCVGAYVYDHDTGQVVTILAKATILASGGLGQIYLHTTNPEGATGDGLAMAYRAGARIINAEYVQFHPTTFYDQGSARFLISEALRGEGGKLLNIDGERFMMRYEPEWQELAPRDVVARSIHREMLRTGSDHVYLDVASVMPANVIRERFPNIYESCRQYDIDPTVGTDPRGSGGALFLWRCVGGLLGPHQPTAALCRGRGHLHGRARRQPAGQLVIVGGARMGHARCARYPLADQRDGRPESNADPPLGGDGHGPCRPGAGAPRHADDQALDVVLCGVGEEPPSSRARPARPE